MTFHAHLETQMADGQQNRFLGVRSFAHLGGEGGHTRGGRGDVALPRVEHGDGLYRGGGKGEVALQRGVAWVHRCVGRRC